MNRNVHEQLCSLSSRQNMSSLVHVIGLEWPKCGTFLIYVEATKGGWSITTTSDLGTTGCQFIMVTSSLVMNATIATPPFKLIALGMKLPRSGLRMPLHRRTVKLLGLQRQCLWSLILLMRPAMRTPLHLSKQGIPCDWLVETVVSAAWATLQKLSG